MRFRAAGLLALAIAGAPPAGAQTAMPLPAAPDLAAAMPFGSLRVATGPFRGTLPAVTAEGRVLRRIWRVPGASGTLELLAPLRDALGAAGWEIVFSCQARSCGGFDFRFEIDVAPAPDMFVDLADYRYLSARKDGAWATLVVSRSGDLGYVQMIEVTPVAPDAAVVAQDGAAIGATIGSAAGAASAGGAAAGASAGGGATLPTAAGDVGASLAATGRAVLGDLDFDTGSTALTQDDYPSLAALAAYLEANPGVTVALVGHTDAEGGAAGNLAISRRRAQSAAGLLTGRYGVAGARVEVQGVGFFAPLGRNDTEAERARNRRVEAVVTSVE